MDNTDAVAFHERLKGKFAGIMQWSQLDTLWDKVRGGEWYLYQPGEEVPSVPVAGAELAQRIDALNALLRREHEYSYCGIVYADDAERPTLIKVYDPSHMGSSCSHNATPAPPGWIFSNTPPARIETRAPTPNNRKRWWQRF